MNSVLANSFTTFFENLFTNWQLVLFIVFVILLILTIFFKRFKTAFFILITAALLVGGVLLTLLIISAVKWDLYGFIDFLIAWAPTILFSLIVVLSTLIGAKRGRRKSLVLMAQSAAAAIVWVLFYYFAVQSTKIDAALVKLVNLFMGEDGVQKAIGVSEQANTFRNILTLYFEHLGGEGALGTLLHDSSAYVYTLADMVYHVGFAVICYSLYLLTVFILYLIYLCFYSERKYKRKKMEAFSENKTDTPYRKHRVAGGFVGLARGMIAGLMCISFIGGGFYMIAGGRGEGKLKDYEVSGKYESQLKIYRSLESYGTQGIFMILNAMSDPNDMPYYLFAADLVFSGELSDEHNEVSENVNLRSELGALSGFARDTITLLIKYGSEEINGALNGTSETGLMQSLLSVMRNDGFQKEFDALIAEFDSPTYVFNFSMSLVSSVLANIDSMSVGGSLSPKNKELLKIMFKDGYLSEYIPEDCILHDINVRMNADDPWSTSGKNKRPYLGLQQLVSKEDTRLFLKIFLTILTERGEGAETFDMIRAIVPQVKELALFENGKSKSVDPVLARIYCYLQNAYLKAEDAESYSYNALVSEKVAWTDEIDSLLDVAEDFFTVFDDVKDAESAVFNRILYIFDQENPNRERDIELYDKITEKVSVSRIMGKTLATSFFHKTLTEGLGQLFENIYIPKNIVYENTFTADGRVETFGELHYFLKGLRHIGTMKDQTLLKILFGEEEQGTTAMLHTIADAMKETDKDKHNFAYYSANSDLLRSLVSSFLIENGDGVIYVPNAVHERNEEGKYVNFIERGELEITLNGMDIIAAFATDCVDGDYYANIDIYLDREDFMALLDTSRIMEGSLALLVRDRLADKNVDEGKEDEAGEEEEGEEEETEEETEKTRAAGSKQNLIVPKYLKDDVENWCTSLNGLRGELKRFIASYLMVRNQAEETADDEEGQEGKEEGGEGQEGEEAESGYKLSLKNLMSGKKKKLLLNTISDLGGKQASPSQKEKIIQEFLSSDIIHYTVSDYFESMPLRNLTIVVPLSARNSLYEDVIESVIKREELIGVFSKVNQLGINDKTNATDLLRQLIGNRLLIEGDVLSASVVVNIVNNNVFCSALRLKAVPIYTGSMATYYTVGEQDYLQNSHYSMNPWKEELPQLLIALEALFEEKLQEEDFVFTLDIMKDTMAQAVYDQEKLAACRKSHILSVGYGSTLSTGGSEEPEEPEETEE